jgi:hypothetical protein
MRTKAFPGEGVVRSLRARPSRRRGQRGNLLMVLPPGRLLRCARNDEIPESAASSARWWRSLAMTRLGDIDILSVDPG